MVIETAGQRPATIKDFRTQELALEKLTQLWELSKFRPIGTHQEEIAKKVPTFYFEVALLHSELSVAIRILPFELWPRVLKQTERKLASLVTTQIRVWVSLT